MDMTLIAEILTVGFGIATTLLGVKYRKVKRTLKELGEAITATSNAIDDDKLTEKEIKSVVKEWNDVVSIWTTSLPKVEKVVHTNMGTWYYKPR